MVVVLAVFTCRSCSSALLRHWPYFLNQNADRSIVIRTEDTGCRVPDGVQSIAIGSDTYIDGDKLPRRMVATLSELMGWKWDALILAEYDTLFFAPINVEKLNEVAGFKAGTIHPEYSFYHNPWVFTREVAWKFIETGTSVIKAEECQGAIASPDVFFGVVCHRMNQPVQDNLWTQFSRNSLDIPGDLDRARFAYHSGIDLIHGVKQEHELEYIIN